MVFSARSIVPGHVHAIGANIPGNLVLLFDVGDIEGQSADTVLHGSLQIFANGIAAMHRPVMRGKINCILSIRAYHPVEVSFIPVSRPLIPLWRMIAAALAAWGGLRAFRAARPFAVVFMAVLHTKGRIN